MERCKEQPKITHTCSTGCKLLVSHLLCCRCGCVSRLLWQKKSAKLYLKFVLFLLYCFPRYKHIPSNKDNTKAGQKYTKNMFCQLIVSLCSIMSHQLLSCTYYGCLRVHKVHILHLSPSAPQTYIRKSQQNDKVHHSSSLCVQRK